MILKKETNYDMIVTKDGIEFKAWPDDDGRGYGVTEEFLDKYVGMVRFTEDNAPLVYMYPQNKKPAETFFDVFMRNIISWARLVEPEYGDAVMSAFKRLEKKGKNIRGHNNAGI